MGLFRVADPAWTGTREHRQLRALLVAALSPLEEFFLMLSKRHMAGKRRIEDGFKCEMGTEEMGDAVEDGGQWYEGGCRVAG